MHCAKEMLCSLDTELLDVLTMTLVVKRPAVHFEKHDDTSHPARPHSKTA
jgi:hypothetical protein